MDKQVCKNCKTEKTLTPENFHRQRNAPSGFRYVCKVCRSSEDERKKGREYSRNCRRTKPEAERNNKIFSTYGVRAEKVLEMFEQQHHKCAICGRVGHLYSKDRKQMLYVDHSHVKGNVRGLLCHYCNSGLGYFQDSTELLDSAKTYLLRN